MESPRALAFIIAFAVTVFAASRLTEAAAPVSLAPASMRRVGTIDERFQSYNVEMLEVTGGKFWKPYGSKAAPKAQPAGDTPAGMDPDIYEYRPPADLTKPRLRKLASALAPAYVRVSGTWANTTWFADEGKASSRSPKGFSGVLTRPQWKGVVDFSRAAGAKIVTSVAISPGVRDASGVWKPEQARQLFDYTRSLGGEIAASEFMNEPNALEMGGAPKDYDAAAYGRDFRLFRAFAKEAAPGIVVLGPGSVGETTGSRPALQYGVAGVVPTRDLLAAMGPGVDAFSYHHYGAASARCAAVPGMAQTTPEAALSEEWLATTDHTLAFYRKLRDELEPGKPMWVTETADAACGGNPWASTFLDTFRYLDQLGRLAKAGVQEVIHNTLASSDYGLLDEKTLLPRPNYWGALLWRRLMGTTVLDSGVPISAGLHVYAHCLRGTPGGVALLLINTDPTGARTLQVPIAARRYTLSAEPLRSREVKLNGATLDLGANDELPALAATPSAAGQVSLAPATITFLALPDAGNAACR